MKQPRVYSAIGLIVLILLVFSQPVMPQIQGGNVIFIFDASGSMWGQVEGKAKIQIAKEVLTDLIRDIPEGINVGLVVYGHRQKGDCQDVEELVPLAVLDKDKIIKKIQAINPKGKTPITLSVEKTAEKLKNVDEETSIILVSDGKETCAGDPCELVKQLKASGVKFTMYVIGFDVTVEEKAQLECMATAGDGTYHEAKNADELSTAAKQMVEKTGKFGVFKVYALKNNKPFSPWIELFREGEKKPFWGGPIETKEGEPGEKTFNLLVEMETNDSPEEIMNFYKAEMTNKGWGVKMALSQGKAASLSMFKEKRGLLLSAGQRSGKTKVTLMITK